MSLFDKLGQRKTEKISKEKEAINAEKKQSVEELAAAIVAANDKKTRLETMLRDLDWAFKGGKQALDSFKGKKEQLQSAYDEHQDILAEDGVNNFEEMLEVNADEIEVKEYRRSGGRAPKNQNEEVGATGSLYKGVKTLVDLKAAIQAEMPDVKLNFAATKRKGEEISNREASYTAIAEYLKNLDQEIIELQKKKEQAYLETSEGKRDLINKTRNVDYTFNNITLKTPDNFYFEDNVLSLSQQIGSEAIKEVYAEKLTEKLKKEAWSNKNKDQRDSYNKSEEQKGIENQPALKELVEARYNRQELQESQALYQEALKHLSSLFKDRDLKDKILGYGLGRYSDKESYRDWDEEKILADRYLQHVAEMGHIIPGFNQSSENFNNLVEQFEKNSSNLSNRNFKDNLYRPEYFHTCFENFNKFFNYIKNETTIESNFVGNKTTQDSVLNRFSNKDFRQQLGLDEFKSDNWPQGHKFSVPKDYIERNGGFSQAWERADNFSSNWEKEKADLEKLSKALVDFRWAQGFERWHREKNKEVLNEYDYNDGLSQNIRHQLETSRLIKDPRFQDRKIKLIDGGFSEQTAIKDVSSEEEYQKNHQERQEIQKEIDTFSSEKKEALEKSMGAIRRALLTFNKESKIEELNKQWRVFDYLKADRQIDWDFAAKNLSPEDFAKVKELAEKRKTNNDEYKAYDQKRLNFLEASSSKAFYLKFRPKDILANQEMTVAELPTRLQNRLKELEVAMNNLPEKEAAIIAERKRIHEELEKAKETMDEVFSKIRK
jgi:hypothetical protein